MTSTTQAPSTSPRPQFRSLRDAEALANIGPKALEVAWRSREMYYNIFYSTTYCLIVFVIYRHGYRYYMYICIEPLPSV